MAQLPNQFAMTAEVGMMDQHFNPCVTSVQVDSTQTGVLIAGNAVTVVNSAGGVPKVVGTIVPAAAIFGFVLLQAKNVSYKAGDFMEIAFFRGSCMYMQVSAAVARDAQVGISGTLAAPTVKTVAATERVIGRAFDAATAAGQLIRVIIDLPGVIA